jgi:CheY-like chemotaxis protein
MAHILIIDDEASLRDVVRDMLEMAGHSVAEARDGREALSIFALDNPDLVITDILMPERDGLETIAALREQHPLLPIVAVSGGGDAGVDFYLSLAGHIGATRTLAKPFRQAALLDAVDGCLSHLA